MNQYFTLIFISLCILISYIQPQENWPQPTFTPSHYWTFDETSGTNLYDSGSDPSTGVNCGAVIQQPGIKDKSYYFNGDAYIQIPHKNSMLGATFTIATWVNFDHPENRDWAGWVTNHKAYDNTNTFKLAHGPRGTDFGVELFANDGARKNQSTPYAPMSHTWYYVVGVFTGTHVQLYVDGQCMGSAAFHGGWNPADNNYDLLIGAGEWSISMVPSCLFRGWVDEVKIWPTALTPQQIQYEFQSVPRDAK